MKPKKWLPSPSMPCYFLSLLLWMARFFLAPGQAIAQEVPLNPQALAIGQDVPDVPIDQIINYPASSARIADFENKLLILDFWATWCAPCISSLNKLDSLQQQFQDNLVVLPVTEEPAAKVAPFLQKRGWQLPSATGNTTLKEFFPHQGLPHQVWIWNGKVAAITSQHYATAANIRRILGGEEVAFKEKEEVAVDPAKPLFINGNGGKGENLLYQSLISRRVQADVGGVSRHGGNRITALNVQLPYLYYEAFSHVLPFSGRSNRVLLEVSNSLRRQLTGEDFPSKLSGDYATDQPFYTWLDRNTYCYSLVLPDKRSKADLNALMQADLNRFFGQQLGIRGSLQRRKVTCLALVRSSRQDLLRTKGGNPAVSSDGQHLQLRNKPISLLVDYIAAANHKQPLPLIDATGYSGSIDIDLSLPLTDLPRLRRELQGYGLDLQEKKHKLDILVISETGTKAFDKPNP